MGSALGSGAGRAAAGEQRRRRQQQQPVPAPGQPPAPSFECAVCLEVLHRPVRTPCGHVFCHSCISASLKNNAWTCPYCRAYLPSEGIPATDIAKKMESTYRNCTECKTQVRLSEMRAHLRTCEKYIEKYGPLQELGDAVTRYSCPYCQCEVDEDELMDHCLAYHRLERRAVCCPICCLTPGRDPSYFSRNFIRHLQLRHTLHCEDYIDINTVGEVLVERVLDGSFLEYVHVSHPNSA
ncbi:E3 ubiquitin-protein ligase RNF125 [Theristicus caerulescens]